LRVHPILGTDTAGKFNLLTALVKPQTLVLIVVAAILHAVLAPFITIVISVADRAVAGWFRSARLGKSLKLTRSGVDGERLLGNALEVSLTSPESSGATGLRFAGKYFWKRFWGGVTSPAHHGRVAESGRRHSTRNRACC
jgi:hypothetical protein